MRYPQALNARGWADAASVLTAHGSYHLETVLRNAKEEVFFSNFFHVETKKINTILGYKCNYKYIV